MNGQPWAVILAGGSGTRLQALTRRIAGDERPKQFCSLYGDRTLLGQTRRRVSRTVSAERTTFSVVKQHEVYYSSELADVKPSRLFIQPANRGTTVAILYSLLAITRVDEAATVAFFPSDHHYADESSFTAAVGSAFELCHLNPQSVVLLGADARRPEVDYGWIEPGANLNSCVTQSLSRVRRFWEKPPLHLAHTLIARGCLWNTFVMIGRAKEFLRLLHSATPVLLSAVEEAYSEADSYNSRMDDLYATIRPGDFSHDVLSVSAQWLTVLHLGDIGWSDLGTPERVAAAQCAGWP